jgi:hypothetical protein
MIITYCLIIGCTALFLNNIGRHWGPGIIFLTLLLLFITLGLAFNHFHDFHDFVYLSFLFYVLLSVFFLCLYRFYSYTACSDPGIVFIPAPSFLPTDNNLNNSHTDNSPVNDEEAQLDDEENILQQRPSSLELQLSTVQKARSSENLISNDGNDNISSNNEGKRADLSGFESRPSVNKIECGLCHIDRPRNAYHCHDCGVCVVELDHHCPVGLTVSFLFCFLLSFDTLLMLLSLLLFTSFIILVILPPLVYRFYLLYLYFIVDRKMYRKEDNSFVSWISNFFSIFNQFCCCHGVNNSDKGFTCF